MKVLSVIIPAYNEERTIRPLLERILAVPLGAAGFNPEIIVVDDGSRDRTAEIAESFAQVRLIRQSNQGKGAAVQRGVREARGDYLLVQDADLEYDPADYVAMLKALPAQGEGVVYGSRPLGQRAAGIGSGKHPEQGWGAWLANQLITSWIFLLYGKWITDPLTAYKLYPTRRVRAMNVRSTGFEADHEMTAKLIRQGIPIIEVPIRYTPRSVAAGKKIKATDGLIALWTLFKYRWESTARKPL
jgi:dolichol-phosphate mannosyltransferase